MADASLVELWAFSVMDENGEPIEGAKLNTYEAGTVNTALATFEESTLTTPLANPILTDAAGRFPNPVYAQNKQYKFVLTDASDNVLQTIPVWQPNSLLDPVATNAALKALDVGLLTEGLELHVTDRAILGDNGGGDWYATEVNPGADNDGSILHSSTAGWFFVRKTEDGIYRPAWFGPDETGVTASHVEVKAMYDAVPDEGTVEFTPGANYLFDIPVEQDNKSLTTFAHGATFKMSPGSSYNAFRFIGDSTRVSQAAYFRWYGGTLDGDKNNQNWPTTATNPNPYGSNDDSWDQTYGNNGLLGIYNFEDAVAEDVKIINKVSDKHIIHL